MKDIYCLKCKSKTKNGEVTLKKTKRGTQCAMTACEACGTKKSCFVTKLDLPEVTKKEGAGFEQDFSKFTMKHIRPLVVSPTGLLRFPNL